MVSIQVLSLAFSHVNLLFTSAHNWDTFQGYFIIAILMTTHDLKYKSMGLEREAKSYCHTSNWL